MAAKGVHCGPLKASDCSDKPIGNIIEGLYEVHGTNHGKTTFRKSDRWEGLDVVIYYWEDEVPRLCGWWIGPSIGTDQVWAYHPSRIGSSPPTDEWSVPHDAAVDPNFRIAAADRVEGSSSCFFEESSSQGNSGTKIEERLWQHEEEQSKQNEEKRRTEEEKRRRLEHEENLRKQEDERRELEAMQRRREEEEFKCQEAERIKREEDEKRRWLEEEMQRIEGEKRRIEEEKRRQEEEDRQRREEDARRQKEEERLLHERDMERKRQEQIRQEEVQKEYEETQRALVQKQELEQQEINASRQKAAQSEIKRRNEATLAVLRALKNLSIADPSTVVTRRLEVEQLLITELPLTGTRQAMLEAEAQRLLEATRKYIENLQKGFPDLAASLMPAAF